MDIDLMTFNEILEEIKNDQKITKKEPIKKNFEETDKSTVIINNLPRYISSEDLYKFLK